MDILRTVQAQYSTSTRLLGLIEGLDKLLSPAQDIQAFYDNVFNLQTARGEGLDVWGEITGVRRNTSMVTAIGVPHFGFNSKADEAATGFDEATFYHGADRAHFKLSDEAYRLHILAKAAANISNGSMGDLNRMLHMLFPKCKVRISRTGPMRLKLIASGKLTDYEKNMLLSGNMPPIPTGVTLEAEINGARYLGFNPEYNSGFNSGPLFGGKFNVK